MRPIQALVGVYHTGANDLWTDVRGIPADLYPIDGHNIHHNWPGSRPVFLCGHNFQLSNCLLFQISDSYLSQKNFHPLPIYVDDNRHGGMFPLWTATRDFNRLGANHKDPTVSPSIHIFKGIQLKELAIPYRKTGIFYTRLLPCDTHHIVSMDADNRRGWPWVMG